MQLSPHINFNGDCAAAFKFYEQVLGAKINFVQTYGQSPNNGGVGPEWRDKVIHIHLTLPGGAALLGSDAPPPHYARPQGIQIMVGIDTTAEAERVFRALTDGGTVTMPFQKTFWSPGFGMGVDRFGISWMVNTNAAPASV